MEQNMVILQIIYPQTREPFGEHLNKTAWKAYSDFQSSQHTDYWYSSTWWFDLNFYIWNWFVELT